MLEYFTESAEYLRALAQRKKKENIIEIVAFIFYLRAVNNIVEMRKIISIAAGALLFTFISCNQPTKSPGEVAVELYSALTSGNVDAVRNNIHIADSIQRKAFFAYLDIAVASEQYQENVKDFNASYTVAEESVNGNNAEVTLVGMGPLNQKLRITVKLLKIDREWKVDGDHGIWHR